MYKKITQKERVYKFIKNSIKNYNGEVYNWHIEAWAIVGFSNNMMSNSALRHCRKLAEEGRIEHPVIDGKIDKHSWVIKKGGKK